MNCLVGYEGTPAARGRGLPCTYRRLGTGRRRPPLAAPECRCRRRPGWPVPGAEHGGTRTTLEPGPVLILRCGSGRPGRGGSGWRTPGRPRRSSREPDPGVETGRLHPAGQLRRDRDPPVSQAPGDRGHIPGPFPSPAAPAQPRRRPEPGRPRAAGPVAAVSSSGRPAAASTLLVRPAA